jgi:ribosomal protein S18 acetylase RimI-like enzyme
MIRNATDADLLQIVKVHSICFPNSFSTKLGSGRELILLQKFYKEYLDVVPELFFVALNNENRIIGFYMGYYCNSNNFQRDFIMHNLLSISIKMFSLLMSGMECYDKSAVEKHPQMR